MKFTISVLFYPIKGLIDCFWPLLLINMNAIL